MIRWLLSLMQVCEVKFCSSHRTSELVHCINWCLVEPLFSKKQASYRFQVQLLYLYCTSNIPESHIKINLCSTKRWNEPKSTTSDQNIHVCLMIKPLKYNTWSVVIAYLLTAIAYALSSKIQNMKLFSNFSSHRFIHIPPISAKYIMNHVWNMKCYFNVGKISRFILEWHDRLDSTSVLSWKNFFSYMLFQNRFALNEICWAIL